MKEIPLTKGQVALVSDEDYEYLMQWKWHAVKSKNTFYVKRSTPRINGKRGVIIMHRLLLELTDKKIQVDHKDRNGLNNQRNNIRICTQSQNLANRRLFKTNKAGYTGVHLRSDSKKWRVVLVHNKVRYNLGLFLNKEEAGNAYKAKLKELHGEFAAY